MKRMNRNHILWVLIPCMMWSFLFGCGDEGKRKPQVSSVPESFEFMGIGANTVIDGDVRDRLKDALGSAAVNPRTSIDLTMKYDGFLNSYYPDLAKLNQRLNVNDVVLKEYPATKLTFRNTKEGSVFTYVELIYGHHSGSPLLIKMIAPKEDIPQLIKRLKEKYGAPEKISTSKGQSWSLSWHKNNDVFVIARLLSRDDQPEYFMMIVYTNRLKQLMARSVEEKQQGAKQAGDIF